MSISKAIVSPLSRFNKVVSSPVPKKCTLCGICTLLEHLEGVTYRRDGYCRYIYEPQSAATWPTTLPVPGKHQG